MQINNCYEKVKKNCFKFIKSQETKTNKFKNKNKMLKSYLIPLCFWINSWSIMCVYTTNFTKIMLRSFSFELI